jgi:hypothetical protein
VTLANEHSDEPAIRFTNAAPLALHAYTYNLQIKSLIHYHLLSAFSFSLKSTVLVLHVVAHPAFNTVVVVILSRHF